MNYYCKRCGYSVSRKDDLRKHLNRKNPCKVKYLDIPIHTLIEELDGKIIEVNTKVNKKVNNSVNIVNIEGNICECKYCGKIFSHKQSRHLHEKKFCKEKITKQEETEFMKQMMAQKDEEMAQKEAEYKEEMALMRKQIELLITKIGNTNIETQNNNNNINNITNIQINGWGHEDTSHLTDKFLRFCYDRPFTSIQRVIEAVFFNPDCPKNWNCMITDDKSSKALIYDSEKNAWLKKETNGILEDLTYTGYSILDENFDKQREANKLTDRIVEKFTKFQDFYAESNKEYEKRLKTEIKELLINYKAYHVKPNNSEYSINNLNKTEIPS